MTAIAFAIEAFTILPGLIDAGIDVIGLINKTNASLQKMHDENRLPTDEEWQELNDTIEALRAQRPDVSGE